MKEERSFAQMTDEDLERLAGIAWATFEEMVQRKPRWAAYHERLLAIALCQDAACHYLDGRTGIKDFDVWLFFAEIPGQPFPYRWHLCRDFGPSRFGRTPGFKGQGRRVDVLGCSLKVPLGADPEAALRAYLEGGRTKSARELRKKAVVLLHPPERRGKVVWRGSCGSKEAPA